MVSIKIVTALFETSFETCQLVSRVLIVRKFNYAHYETVLQQRLCTASETKKYKGCSYALCDYSFFQFCFILRRINEIKLICMPTNLMNSIQPMDLMCIPILKFSPVNLKLYFSHRIGYLPHDSYLNNTIRL